MFTIREDGRIEWQCKHGVGHTIALSRELIVRIYNTKDTLDTHFSHGCDGCCSADSIKVGKY